MFCISYDVKYLTTPVSPGDDFGCAEHRYAAVTSRSSFRKLAPRYRVCGLAMVLLKIMEWLSKLIYHKDAILFFLLFQGWGFYKSPLNIGVNGIRIHSVFS